MATNMQANLGFVESQVAHIEPQVYQIKYPDIQYPELVPVDTSAHPWIKTVTYYSADGVGKAKWINGKAGDIPVVGASMQQFETGVFMAGIGYDIGLEEVEQAKLLGIGLEDTKAALARRAYEEMVDTIALTGDVEKGWKGLFNYASVPAVAAVNGASASPLWANKTPAEILKDFNDAVTGIFTTTKTVALADTILVPWERLSPLTTVVLPNTSMTILEFIRQNNIYTMQTGKPLTIRGVRNLATAGAGSTARMIAYRRNPEVLKLHIPMPHQFLPVQIVGMQYLVPGIFRLGGVDVRLPNEIRYIDGI